ncbi:MAG TPA: ABC transporter ATP-binding protein, partial [Phormidium sp.]
MQLLLFLKLINKYITPYRWLALFLLSSHIFDAGFEAAMRMSLKFIIDAAIVPKNYGLLILILLLLGGGAIAVTVVGLVGDFFSARFGVLVINDIRRSLFEQVQSLSMEFFGRRSAGDIVNCFLADTEKVENGLTIGLATSIWNFSNILFSAIFLFFINWQLAVLSCIGLTVCIIAPTGILRRATKAGYHLRQKEGNIASVVEENILSQGVVKIFGLEKRASKDFGTNLNDLKRVYVRAKFLSFLVQRVPNLTFILVQLVILSISAAMAYWNLISVGTLVSYQVLLIGLHSTIINFTWSLPYLIDGLAGLQRLSEILAEIPQVQEATDAVDLPHFQSDIYFDNVNFSYSSERAGVENLSLKIRQGDFAVFVGHSGAGKSTIVNLLARFYDPDKGRILFDGIDLRDCTIRSLRSQIGLVSQEVILFNGS